jgi:hypothetical protein
VEGKQIRRVARQMTDGVDARPTEANRKNIDALVFDSSCVGDRLGVSTVVGVLDAIREQQHHADHAITRGRRREHSERSG